MRTAANRRKANWVSSSGRQKTGSAHSPATAVASEMTTPVAQIAEPMPSSARNSSRSSGPYGQPVRARASAAASTASHSAVSASRPIRKSG